MKMEVFLLSGGESPMCIATALSTTKLRTGVNALKQATGRGKMLIGALETYGAGGLEIISALALWGLTAHW